MYKDCSNRKRTVVVYKGEHVEKDLLKKLNIPCLSEEKLACPEYDKLRHTGCGFHADDKFHHCPVKID